MQNLDEQTKKQTIKTVTLPIICYISLYYSLTMSNVFLKAMNFKTFFLYGMVAIYILKVFKITMRPIDIYYYNIYAFLILLTLLSVCVCKEKHLVHAI